MKQKLTSVFLGFLVAMLAWTVPSIKRPEERRLTAGAWVVTVRIMRNGEESIQTMTIRATENEDVSAVVSIEPR